jgi:hypothetical protein
MCPLFLSLHFGISTHCGKRFPLSKTRRRNWQSTTLSDSLGANVICTFISTFKEIWISDGSLSFRFHFFTLCTLLHATALCVQCTSYRHKYFTARKVTIIIVTYTNSLEAIYILERWSHVSKVWARLVSIFCSRHGDSAWFSPCQCYRCDNNGAIFNTHNSNHRTTIIITANYMLSVYFSIHFVISNSDVPRPLISCSKGCPNSLLVIR